MFAAEFNYSWDYVKWEMEFWDVMAHLDYRESCPPAGMMIRTIVEAFAGEKVGFSYSKEQAAQTCNDLNLNPEYQDKQDLMQFLAEASAAGFTMR
jgi:hypothetical protein